MALTIKDKWLWNGRVNAVFERARQSKAPPQDMLATDAMNLLRAGGLKFSECGEIMRGSKYGEHARKTGYPLCAMPIGKTEADPPAPKKRDFWKPPL